MSNYSFRVRFQMPSKEKFNIEEAEIQISDVFPFPIRLISGESDQGIKDASILIFRADGFSTEEEALAAAEACRDTLITALASLHVGVDFGDRSPKSFFFKAGLKLLQENLGERVLDDQPGIMTFRSEPQPKFARLGTPTAIRGRDKAALIAALRDYTRDAPYLSDREHLAFDLFSSSFFQPSQDARLILLVIAVESLLTQQERAQAAIDHVEHLIDQTKNATGLSDSERNSIIGSLQWLRSESIRQSAKRMAEELLPDQEYMGLPSTRFLLHAYDLRSRIVHGEEPFPTRNEVANVAGPLELLVGDLLSVPHLRAAS